MNNDIRAALLGDHDEARLTHLSLFSGIGGLDLAAEKPEVLMGWLVNESTKQGETVVDLFMGSGTTGVACVNTGRKFIGMELDPGYFEMAKRRIREAQAQARLAWNTRAPILSESELKKLEELE